MIRMAYEILPDRPYSDPDYPARKILEIANNAEAVRAAEFTLRRSTASLFREGGAPAGYKAGLIWRSTAAG